MKSSMMAPGSWCEPRFKADQFVQLIRKNRVDLVIADQRVLSLHPSAEKAIAALEIQLIALRAGEGAKSLKTLEKLSRHSTSLKRGARILALGGGTIGDVATVFAHLHKRGAELIHVPTTLLAAVDSSIGGKGAINVGGVKNTAGVFHYATEIWHCEEFFKTLTAAQIREGLNESLKIQLTCGREPIDAADLQRARALKLKICREDPYELTGTRVVLNFGHTIGHAIESLSDFRIRHGAAVGLGILCALDVGAALGIGSPDLIRHLSDSDDSRKTLSRLLRNVEFKELRTILSADKKGASAESINMVLLKEVGHWVVRPVKWSTLAACFPLWKRGAAL